MYLSIVYILCKYAKNSWTISQQSFQDYIKLYLKTDYLLTVSTAIFTMLFSNLYVAFTVLPFYRIAIQHV